LIFFVFYITITIIFSKGKHKSKGKKNYNRMSILYKTLHINEVTDENMYVENEDYTNINYIEKTYKKFGALLKEYNYETMIILYSLSEYNDIIPDDILQVIANYDILVITMYCYAKLDNLPNNIKLIYIETVKHYIHPLDNLNSNLEHLIFTTNYFEQTLDLLPFGLKTLIFNRCSNVPLNNLPATLKYLEVSGRYNIPLINLPQQLETLRLSEYYQNELINLPLGLKDLYIGSDYYLSIKNLPDSIEELTISGSPEYIDKLPNNLKIFNIGYDASYFIELVDSIEEISVNTMSLSTLYNLLDYHLPKNLHTISLCPLSEVYIHPETKNKKYKIFPSEYEYIDELSAEYPTLTIKFADNYFAD